MRREALLLDEIIGAAQRATDIATRLSVGGLADNLDARDAVLWNLTVIGEAVNQLPEGPRAKCPEVPWSQPMRLRNRIVHGYWSVDLDVIHAVALGDLPASSTRSAPSSPSCPNRHPVSACVQRR
jgi:uncharacterized protein with HEPN domain